DAAQPALGQGLGAIKQTVRRIGADQGNALLGFDLGQDGVLVHEASRARVSCAPPRQPAAGNDRWTLTQQSQAVTGPQGRPPPQTPSCCRTQRGVPASEGTSHRLALL